MKSKFLALLEILRRETDVSQPLSRQSIELKLNKNNIRLDKKTLAAYLKDEDNIPDGKIKIIGNACTCKYYYEPNNECLDMSELTIITDCLISLKFLSPKQTKGIVNKLCRMTTKANEEMLKKKLVDTKDIKIEDEYLFNKIKIITDAIKNNKQLIFNYMRYTPELQKIVRMEGQYVICQALMVDNGYYYLYAYVPESNDNYNFRIDRMQDVKISEIDSLEIPTNLILNYAEFRKSNFNMYSGEKKKVKLLCIEKMANQIFDKFGKESKVTRIKNDAFNNNDLYFTVEIEVQITPTFYAWLCMYNGQIKLIEPESEIERYREYLHKLIN